MKLEPKDFFESCLKFLNPLTVRRRFVEISGSLEGIIREAHDDLSRVEEKIVEDRDAAQYSLIGLNIEQYEEVLSKMLQSILETEDYRDGLFCGATSPNWEHIQTAYILHTFSQLELSHGSWFVHNKRRSVEIMLSALIKAQGVNGTWGEDFYDTCYTLSALLLFQSTHGSLTDFKNAVSRASNYIIKEIDAGFVSQINQEWYGAGFHGAALALLGRHGTQLCQICKDITQQKVKACLQKLLGEAMKFYVEKGSCAHFKSDLTSHPTTPDEWHTAEVLVGLHYSSGELGPNRPIISKCVEWLEGRRGDRFLWCNDMGSRISFIITGRVLHALALVDSSKAGAAIARLAPVLKHHQTSFACSTGLRMS